MSLVHINELLDVNIHVHVNMYAHEYKYVHIYVHAYACIKCTYPCMYILIEPVLPDREAADSRMLVRMRVAAVIYYIYNTHIDLLVIA